MNAIESKVEEALSKVDDNLQPIVDEENKDDDTKTKQTDDTKDVDSEEDDQKDDTTNDDKEVTEYTANDGEEVDAPAVQTDVPTDSAGIVLSTGEQKYLADNIGQPITIRGMVGDKETEMQVYATQQIPQGFNFNSHAEMLQAQEAMNRLERRAEQLLGGYRTEQSNAQSRDFESRENEGIRQDVADLQADKEFPNFKIKPGTKGFDDDPAAVQMADVLNLMTERNNQYLKEYQQGRQYRHIGFREALTMWQKQQAPKTQEKAQKKEDAERKQVAEKVGGGGLSANGLRKPTFKSGTTLSSIINNIDNMEI